ncbi:HAD domain-containing protein [Falsiroseomonas sp. E2-1-a20]|uniref:HAD domain-containing protein n=1 Tax=Falsiroseomonas sp. E2-1-a20 TaxID=3239300 RepID=UPI003F388C7F
MDVDGVLLTRGRWLHERNAAARSLLAEGTWESRRQAMLTVSFDEQGVWLVDRLARLAGARIVVASLWRRSLQQEELVQKLAAEGLDISLLHEDPVCAGGASTTVSDEVLAWLGSHRLTPRPAWPEECGDPAEETRRLRDYTSAFHDDGWDWVVLDDRRHLQRWVRVDGLAGLCMATYRVALRALSGEDPQFGMYPIDEVLWREVVDALDGDPVEAAAWIEGRVPVADPPIDLLRGWCQRRAAGVLSGVGVSLKEVPGADAVAAFRARLAQDRPAQEPEPEPSGAGCDADF